MDTTLLDMSDIDAYTVDTVIAGVGDDDRIS